MSGHPTRKRIRIQDYDYSEPNAYFLTLCIAGRQNILWEMQKVNEPLTSIPLTKIGSVIDKTISEIPNHYPNVSVDKYVIMPNHIHLILVISELNNAEDGTTKSKPPTISRIINQMKGIITKKVGRSIWQKLFYEHIIRNDEEYGAYLDYIEANPLNWMDDRKFGS